MDPNLSVLLSRVFKISKQSLDDRKPFDLNKILLEKECSFQESVKHLLLHGLNTHVALSHSFAESFPPENRNGIAAINLYTRDCPLSTGLNLILRKGDYMDLTPYIPFLKIFLSALYELPEFKGSVWSGMKDNISGRFTKGKKLVLTAFTSCLRNENTLRTNLGQSRTIFHIRCLRGYDITEYSVFPSESEILLLPGTYLRVTDTEDGDGWCFIELEQIPPESLPSLISLDKTLTAEESFELGMKYFGENSAKKNYRKALELFQHAVEEGHTGAKYYLGLMYSDGLGVPRDYTKAYSYFESLAILGDAAGLKELGKMYCYGLGVPQDYVIALDYYRRSAEKEYPPGLNDLGYMYRKGLGVARDDEMALKYYRMAADRGNVSAANNVGYMYRQGLGVNVDYPTAVKYFQMAVDLGSSSGKANLGYMYEEGLGVEQDYDKAVEYYRKSADQGNSCGQYRLGQAYHKGRGVVQDDDMALKYIQMAADQGYVPAQEDLIAVGPSVMKSTIRGSQKSRTLKSASSSPKRGRPSVSLRRSDKKYHELEEVVYEPERNKSEENTCIIS